MGASDYDDEDYDEEDEDEDGEYGDGEYGGMIADRDVFDSDDDDDELDLDMDFGAQKDKFKKAEAEEKKKEEAAKILAEDKKKLAADAVVKKREAEAQKKKDAMGQAKRDSDAQKKREDDERKKREAIDRTRQLEADERDRQNQEDDAKRDPAYDSDINSEISGFGAEEAHADEDDQDQSRRLSQKDPDMAPAHDDVDSLLAELLEEDARIQDDLYAANSQSSPDTKRHSQASAKNDYSDTFSNSNRPPDSLKNAPPHTNPPKPHPSNPPKPDLKNSNFSFHPTHAHPSQPPTPTPPNPNPPFGPGPYPSSGYAAEALLHDERVKGNKLSGAYESERDKARSWEKAYYGIKEEAEKNLYKLTLSDKRVEELARELSELKIEYGRASVEIEELVRQLDIKDIKIDEVMRGNKVLEQYNAQKERLMREHKGMFEKSYTNTALEQLKKQTDLEIESWKVKYDMVTGTLGQAEARIGELEGEGFNQTGGIRMQAVHENNVNDLKSQIIILQNKLMEKARMDGLDDPEDETTKEVMLQDIIIKGYASANNRLIDENKLLKENLNKLNDHNIEDQKKFNQTYAKLTHWTPLPEDDMKATITRLQDELLRKDDFYRKKESKKSQENLDQISGLKNEINSLKGDAGAQV